MFSFNPRIPTVSILLLLYVQMKQCDHFKIHVASFAKAGPIALRRYGKSFEFLLKMEYTK